MSDQTAAKKEITERDLSAWSMVADAEEKNRRLGCVNWTMIVRLLIMEVRRLRNIVRTSDHNAMATRLIDEMLSAQSRFSQAWRDDKPLTAMQLRDEKIRDDARGQLMSMLRKENKNAIN